jgi:PST family polysaccharide transporter
LVNNADNLIVGKILGAQQLGFYQTGFNVANTTTGDVGDLGAQTVFPIYTAIHDDKKRLQHAMLRAVVGIGALIALPIIVILMQPALVVRVVLGETWLPIVPLLPYLYAALWLKGINLLMYPIFLATSK